MNPSEQLLMAENARLWRELLRLRAILDCAGISYAANPPAAAPGTGTPQEPPSPPYPSYPPLPPEPPFPPLPQDYIIMPAITMDHARLLDSVFSGRHDVYSKRDILKDGRAAYFPQCENFWQEGVCLKRIAKENGQLNGKKGKGKIQCMNCEARQWSLLGETILISHLQGNSEDCTDVIGVYPLLPDNTCNFLVFDFDNHDSDLNDAENQDDDWREEVNALRAMCVQQGFFTLTERSRSGKGAHIWLFFENPIPAILARKFGSALLTVSSETIGLKSFKSYDRMLPAQDTLPPGGLGNLIALPLQGQALRRGNSAFIDENWHAYPNQWEQLRNIRRITQTEITEKLREWGLHDNPLGISSFPDEPENEKAPSPDTSSGLGLTFSSPGDKKPDAVPGKRKPWEKNILRLTAAGVDGALKMTLANRIYIETGNLHTSAKNVLKRMGAFGNPEFYKHQAMGYSTRGISRIVWCGSEEDGYITVPRGRLEALKKNLEEEQIPGVISDLRQRGKPVRVSFRGQLYPEQLKAANVMLEHETGILHAATAFGKTAVGSYLIAAKKVSALVIVQNREILQNWVQDLGKFLLISEDPPKYRTPAGRLKTRKSVLGSLYSGHNTLGGIIDVAMSPSLAKAGDKADALLESYGLVIVDECHHAAAQNIAAVIDKVCARYVYGLTATVKRDDGMEQKVFMLLGPVLWRFTSKERIAQQGFRCFVRTRFTALVNAGKPWPLQEAYKIAIHDKSRNDEIARDARECITAGHSPLILTKFREHAEVLLEMLRDAAYRVFLLHGGRKTSEREAIRQEMLAVPPDKSVLLIAIGQYVGEGFNYSRLDTLFLTCPISFDGNVEQYAGRLLRTYEGKTEITIYDYADGHVPVFAGMFRKRLRAYKKIGYAMAEPENLKKPREHKPGFYDSQDINRIFWADVCLADQELIISSPGINREQVMKMLDMLTDLYRKNIRVSVYTLPPEKYPEKQQRMTQALITAMQENGIWVLPRPDIHEHFAVIDREIVWYGSANLLSRSQENDGMLRLADGDIARNLLAYLANNSS